jgi:hypothetical protein
MQLAHKGGTWFAHGMGTGHTIVSKTCSLNSLLHILGREVSILGFIVNTN